MLTHFHLDHCGAMPNFIKVRPPSDCPHVFVHTCLSPGVSPHGFFPTGLSQSVFCHLLAPRVCSQVMIDALVQANVRGSEYASCVVVYSAPSSCPCRTLAGCSASASACWSCTCLLLPLYSLQSNFCMVLGRNAATAQTIRSA